MKKLSLLFAACVGSVLSCSAEVLSVVSNADSGDGTLRALLSTAADNDVVEIPADMTIVLESTLTLPKLNLTIRGNGETSVVSGNDSFQLIEINHGKSVRYSFESLVLEKGFNGEGGGAGFKFTNISNATVVMNDCIVRDMTVTPLDKNKYNRGVFMHGGKESFDFYATNTVFSGLRGGAAVMSLGNNYGTSSRNFVLSKCKIINNGDVDSPSYSVLFIGSSADGETLIDGCLIAGNVSVGTASVAYSDSKSSTRGYVFRNCIITNNLTTTGSGTFNLSNRRHMFADCVISDNTALNNAVYYATGGQGVEFRNCLMERNCSTNTNQPWDSTGLFFIRQPASDDYQEIFLLSNCVVRANYSSGSSLMGTYDGGAGIIRFVDTLFSDNVVAGNKIMSSSRTNIFTRCAIVGNTQDSSATKEASDGVFTGQHLFFDNCLLVGNDMRRTRYFISSPITFTSCTLVSNTCSSAYTYPALNPGAGSVLVDTVMVGTVCAANHTTAENDIACSAAPAVTNCYFERAGSVASAVGIGIFTGSSMSDLGLQWELTTNRSNTVFLDGSRMPTMVFSEGSPLRDGGVRYPTLSTLDLINCKRCPWTTPDIGCWEYPESIGLMLFLR